MERSSSSWFWWSSSWTVFLAIWLPAPIGLVALTNLRRTLSRWASEDVPAAVRPPPPVPRAVVGEQAAA